MTYGPRLGPDPEDIPENARYILLWGINSLSTNSHLTPSSRRQGGGGQGGPHRPLRKPHLPLRRPPPQAPPRHRRRPGLRLGPRPLPGGPFGLGVPGEGGGGPGGVPEGSGKVDPKAGERPHRRARRGHPPPRPGDGGGEAGLPAGGLRHDPPPGRKRPPRRGPPPRPPRGLALPGVRGHALHERGLSLKQALPRGRHLLEGDIPTKATSGRTPRRGPST